MIVDEEFKKVNSSFHMGAVQVPLISGATEKQQLTGPANMTVRRNGWLYVYLSNESNQDVYFDDLVVNQKRGPVVEQNNYYAFGLEIPGLASKAIGFGTSPQNRKKFNGIEHDSDFDLNIDEAFYRNYDPQTGRWWQVDPEIENGMQDISPYSSMHNNPVLVSDPLGDFDDYQLKQDGNIALVKKTDDKTDKLYASDNKGNVNKDKSITVQKGILNNVQSGTVSGGGVTYNYNFLEVKGSAATSLFKFVANNSNVEWSFMKFDNGQNFISTSHEHGIERGATGLLEDKNLNLTSKNLIEKDHSHPDGIHYPSGRQPKGAPDRPGDVHVSKLVDKMFPGRHIRYNIYTPSDGKFTPYSSSTYEPELQEVIITAPRRKKN